MARILVVRRKASLAPPAGDSRLSGAVLSKTEEIRAAAAADPSATPSQIAPTLNARGIPTTSAVETEPANRGATGQKAAAAEASLSMADLCRARQMSDQLGGLQRARQLLDALGELMD